jgi:hypothetical protein
MLQGADTMGQPVAMRFGILLLCTMLLAAPAPMTADPALAQAASQQKHPDVVGAKVTPRGEGRFDFDVTISSPYDTAARYADGFRVIGPKGEVYGERKLLHDHADEQPFTRDLHGVAIPAGVRAVVVEARDQRHGYGGRKLEVALPGR